VGGPFTEGVLHRGGDGSTLKKVIRGVMNSLFGEHPKSWARGDIIEEGGLPLGSERPSGLIFESSCRMLSEKGKSSL